MKRTEASPLVGAPAQKTRLFLLLPRWRQILICVLLTASLGLNIAALCPGTPFLLLHADPPLDVFLPPGNYGLGSTLSLLAAHHLYVLYALIVCFSLLFPPAKLICIAILLGKELTTRDRQQALSVLGHLGRWSLLDIYFAMLLMMIVWHQGIDVTIGPIAAIKAGIGTQAQYGLYVFHASIICSMLVVTMLQDLNPIILLPPKPYSPPLSRRPLLFYGGVRSALGVLLSCITLVLGLCGVLFPVFEIVGVEQDGVTVPLNPISHNIARSIFETTPIFATDMLISILITPTATMLFCIGIQLIPLSSAERWCYTTIRYLSEWSMFDVYAFAFIVYLSQEGNLISLKLKPATYCMFFYLPFMVGAVWMSEMSVRRALSARIREAALERPGGSRPEGPQGALPPASVHICASKA